MALGIFMGSGHIEAYYDIFDQDSTAKLKSMLTLYPDLITKETINQYRNDILQAEYVFSSWGMPALSKEEIAEYLPNLKAVFYAAGSVQAFAKPFLESNVKVFSAWAANAVPVAEYSLAQIILANKGYFQSIRKTAQEDYSGAGDFARTFKGNYSSKVGIIGAGMIGKELIRLLKPFSLEVLVYDPFLPETAARELGVKLTTLEDLFENCDIVSNHLANNAQTKGMLSGRLFSLMKDNATFINTGRGAQVIEDDLIQALVSHPNRTALLDVTEPEPPVKSSRLYSLGNVFLTPHIAGSMGNEVRRMGAYMTEECRRLIHGEETRYEITAKLLETMA